jgi:hypothetical protein
VAIKRWQYQVYAAPLLPPPVTVDRWVYALSEPVRTKVAVAFQQFLALNPTTPAPVVMTNVLLGTSQQLSRTIIIGY